MLQVTPAELIDVDFTKPKHRNSISTVHYEEQNSASVLPVKKAKVTTGPQNVPKISAETLYHSICKSAPQACLFTIVPGFERQQGQRSVENTRQVALSEQTMEPISVPTDDPEQPIISTDDPEQLTVLTDDPEQLTALTDDPEQLTVLTDDPEELTVLTDDPEQLTVLTDDPEQLTVLTDEYQGFSRSTNSTHQHTSLMNGPNSDCFPVSLIEYFSQLCRNVTDENVMEKAEQLFYELNITQEQCDAIESTTRRQRESDAWHHQCQGRLTASSFHSVLNMKSTTDPSNFLQRVLTKEDLSHIPAIKWGIEKEDTTREEYTRKMSQLHENFKCTTAGLVVNPQYPHLGATPDGFVTCTCCRDGLVEIQCPFSAKDSHPDILRSQKSSFLNARGLIISHKYYTQVQGQLLITDKDYCDFVVWTPCGITIQRIYQDLSFSEKLEKKN